MGSPGFLPAETSSKYGRLGACGHSTGLALSNPLFRTNLEWRGPLHPAKLTSLRSLFAARSAPVAIEWRGPLHPAKLTSLRSLFAARSAPFASLTGAKRVRKQRLASQAKVVLRPVRRSARREHGSFSGGGPPSALSRPRLCQPRMCRGECLTHTDLCVSRLRCARTDEGQTL